MERFIKITEDLYYDTDRLDRNEDISNYLVDRVSLHLLALSSDAEMIFEESLIDCESPIEQLLSLALENLNIKNIYKCNPFIDVVEIEKQKEIQCENKKYRVDFCIPVIYKNQENKSFIIECDGHEFHQKTKEQVKHDNEREYDLKMAGYEIIRFSGSQIYNDPFKCAEDAYNYIMKSIKGG